MKIKEIRIIDILILKTILENRNLRIRVLDLEDNFKRSGLKIYYKNLSQSIEKLEYMNVIVVESRKPLIIRLNTNDKEIYYNISNLIHIWDFLEKLWKK